MEDDAFFHSNMLKKGEKTLVLTVELQEGEGHLKWWSQARGEVKIRWNRNNTRTLEGRLTARKHNRQLVRRRHENRKDFSKKNKKIQGVWGWRGPQGWGRIWGLGETVLRGRVSCWHSSIHARMHTALLTRVLIWWRCNTSAVKGRAASCCWVSSPPSISRPARPSKEEDPTAVGQPIHPPNSGEEPSPSLCCCVVPQQDFWLSSSPSSPSSSCSFPCFSAPSSTSWPPLDAWRRRRCGSSRLSWPGDGDRDRDRCVWWAETRCRVRDSVRARSNTLGEAGAVRRSCMRRVMP